MQARSIFTLFAIVCLGLSVQATYIPDHLLGKLAPPLIFLGGAAGTALGGAAVGFIVGSKLCHGHGCGGPLIKIGGLDAFTDFFHHPGSRHGHMRGGHH